MNDPVASLQAQSSKSARILPALAAILMVLGVILAVTRPTWLTLPLEAAVEQAGAAAPLVYVLLCALAAPLHLNGVLVALSSVIWPLWAALLLSFVGTLLGCVATASLLSRMGGVALRQQANWPGWLQQLAAQVQQRHMPIGLLARVAIGSGMALEAFYIVTGYTRRQYVAVTVLGLAVWVTQALLGVTVLRALLQQSAGLAVLAAVVPVLMMVAALAFRRRQRKKTSQP